MALQRLMNRRNNFEFLSALTVLLSLIQIISKQESLKLNLSLVTLCQNNLFEFVEFRSHQKILHRQ